MPNSLREHFGDAADRVRDAGSRTREIHGRVRETNHLGLKLGAVGLLWFGASYGPDNSPLPTALQPVEVVSNAFQWVSNGLHFAADGIHGIQDWADRSDNVAPNGGDDVATADSLDVTMSSEAPTSTAAPVESATQDTLAPVVAAQQTVPTTTGVVPTTAAAAEATPVARNNVYGGINCPGEPVLVQTAENPDKPGNAFSPLTNIFNTTGEPVNDLLEDIANNLWIDVRTRPIKDGGLNGSIDTAGNPLGERPGINVTYWAPTGCQIDPSQRLHPNG